MKICGTTYKSFEDARKVAFGEDGTYGERQVFYLQALFSVFKNAYRPKDLSSEDKVWGQRGKCELLAAELFDNAGCIDLSWSDPFGYKDETPLERNNHTLVKAFSSTANPRPADSHLLNPGDKESKQRLSKYFESLFEDNPGDADKLYEYWGLSTDISWHDFAKCLAEGFFDIGARPVNKDTMRSTVSNKDRDWADVRAKVLRLIGDEEGATPSSLNKGDLKNSPTQTPEGFQDENDDLTAISSKLHKVADRGRAESYRDLPFVGRKWLMEDVIEWNKDINGPNICLISGDAGVGKSAFAAHLLNDKSTIPISAAVFCLFDSSNNPLDYGRRVIETLAYRLACNLPHFRPHLLSSIEATPDLNSLPIGDLFETLLISPILESTAVDDGGLTLLIDGLDEAGTSEENPLADALSRYCYDKHLPNCLKILVTCKDIASITSLFDANVTTIKLQIDDPNNREDIKNYLLEQLKDQKGLSRDFEDSILNLAESSGGNFLHAKLIADAILKGNTSINNVIEFPAGLSSAFHQWFSWTFPDFEEYKTLYRMPLSCITFEGPLPENELTTLFGWTKNEICDFFRKVEVFISRGHGPFGNTLYPSHSFLRTWLCSDVAGCYQCSDEDTLSLMSSSYYQKAISKPNTLTDYELATLFFLLKDTLNELEKICSNDYIIKRALDLLAFSVERDDRYEEMTIVPRAAYPGFQGMSFTLASNLLFCANMFPDSIPAQYEDCLSEIYLGILAELGIAPQFYEERGRRHIRTMLIEIDPTPISDS